MDEKRNREEEKRRLKKKRETETIEMRKKRGKKKHYVKGREENIHVIIELCQLIKLHNREERGNKKRKKTYILILFTLIRDQMYISLSLLLFHTHTHTPE